MDGRIKIYRKIDDWGWRSKPNTFSLFIYLLTNANTEERIYQGQTIKRGDCIVGRDSLSKKLGISQQSIRTSLEHLKSTNEITIKSTNKFSIITVVCFDLYQSQEKKQPTKQPSNQQTTNQQLTTPKEYKNKEIINNNAFEIFRKQYPHARKGKKQEALSYFNKQDADEVMQEVHLLNRKIEIGEQNPTFIPACERRIRDFTKTSELLKPNTIKNIAYFIFTTQGETRVKYVDRFIAEFGKDTLELYRKQWSTEKNGIKFNLK